MSISWSYTLKPSPLMLPLKTHFWKSPAFRSFKHELTILLACPPPTHTLTLYFHHNPVSIDWLCYMWGEQTPVSLGNKWVQNFHFTRWKELWGWMVMMADSTMNALAPLNCTFKNGWGKKKVTKKKKNGWGDFHGSPVEMTLPFQCRGTRSIPSWGSKIPHTAEHGEKKR